MKNMTDLLDLVDAAETLRNKYNELLSVWPTVPGSAAQAETISKITQVISDKFDETRGQCVADVQAYFEGWFKHLGHLLTMFEACGVEAALTAWSQQGPAATKTEPMPGRTRVGWRDSVRFGRRF